MFKSNKVPSEPLYQEVATTIEVQVAEVQASLDAALSAFTRAADALEDTADVASSVATDIDDQIDALIRQQSTVSDAAYRAREKANALRQFAAV